MPFIDARGAEILRAVQKDDSFLESMKSIAADVIQKSLGTRVWLQYYKWINNACEILYYSLTTIALRQTLGEEYTGLLMVNNNKTNIPSITVRILMICLQCLGPTFIRYLINKTEVSMRRGFLSTYLRPEIKESFLNIIPVLKLAPNIIFKLHLATFYLNGAFYHLSKRIAGVKYVLLRSWFGDSSVIKSFRLLGVIIFANTLLVMIYSIFDLIKKRREKSKSANKDVLIDPEKQCPLCLELRKFSSVTPCGHLFCWFCIHESMNTNRACPLCRHPCSPNEIVPLMNM